MNAKSTLLTKLETLPLLSCLVIFVSWGEFFKFHKSKTTGLIYLSIASISHKVHILSRSKQNSLLNFSNVNTYSSPHTHKKHCLFVGTSILYRRTIVLTRHQQDVAEAWFSPSEVGFYYPISQLFHQFPLLIKGKCWWPCWLGGDPTCGHRMTWS